jgi:hypothetical protein
MKVNRRARREVYNAAMETKLCKDYHDHRRLARILTAPANRTGD